MPTYIYTLQYMELLHYDQQDREATTSNWLYLSFRENICNMH